MTDASTAATAGPDEITPLLSLDSSTLVETIVAGDFEPTLVTLSSGRIWWLDSQGGNLWQTDLSSKASTSTVSAPGIVAIAATPDRIGWVARDGVFVSDLGGSHRIRVHRVVTSSFGAVIFANDDFYFSDGTFMWVSRGGRSPAVRRTNAWGDEGVVAAPQQTFMANNERGLFWGAQGMLLSSADAGPFFTFFPTSGAEITAMTSSGGAIAYADKKGDVVVIDVVAQRKVWAAKRNDVVAMAVRNNDVYWARTYDDMVLIEKTPLLGGETTPVLRFRGKIGQMVADGDLFVWTMPADGRLVRLR